MNNKENKKRLKQTMAMLKIKMENLKPHIETSERINSMYNKMLIEKAIIKKELDASDKTNPSLLKKKTKFFQPRGKTLISDYFHS